MGVEARHHVVEGREVLEQADLLERARDAVAHAPVRGHAREIETVEGHRAGIGRIDAAQEIE